MTAFHVYAINAIVALIGAFLFLWWWRKTGRATTIYILVTLLFVAEFIEKSVFTYLRWGLQYGSQPFKEAHRQVVMHPYWWTVTTPTTIAFFLIVLIMARRIYRSHKAMRLASTMTLTPQPAARHVLLISNRKATRSFMRNVFATAQVAYSQSVSIIGGLETLVAQPSLSVVVIGLSAVEDSGLRQSTVVKMIKKERPWCCVVALSRQPNLYELVEARRSFFDDYLYLPIRAGVLLSHFERWISKTNRWKRLDLHDRRKRSGSIGQRRGVRIRKTPERQNKSDETFDFGEDPAA